MVQTTNQRLLLLLLPSFIPELLGIFECWQINILAFQLPLKKGKQGETLNEDSGGGEKEVEDRF